MLERVAPGHYRRELDRTWWGHDAQFGGYVQALALTALRTELEMPEMVPVSMGIQFFRPFGDGPFRAEVSVMRRGRTMANAFARLFSQEKLAGVATAAFGVRRERAEFLAAEPPQELHARPVQAGEEPIHPTLGVPTHDHFTFFPRIGVFAAGAGGARVGGWVCQRRPGPVDENLMVVLTDLWIPAAYHHWRAPAVAVSVDITSQFRARFPAPGVREDDPLFVVLRTAGSIGGFVDEDCEIWSPRGELLAQGRQMRYVHG
jgi:acyl-CoA thioesterase